MYLGHIVESGPVEAIYEAPQHPYTRALLASRLSMDPQGRMREPPLVGDPPNPIAPPSGCRCRTRCPHVQDVCTRVTPHLPLPLHGTLHAVACHMYDAASGHPDAIEAMSPHRLVALLPPHWQSPVRQPEPCQAAEPCVPPPLVEVRDLCVRFVSREATVHAVNRVSFTMQPGEVMCIIGESGSGKSVTLRALMRLLPARQTVLTDAIRIADHDILALKAPQLSDVRGTTVAMIFQEPMMALDATVQMQVLILLRQLQEDLGMGVIFVTHDLGVAAEIADTIAVMYAGRIVETGSVQAVLQRPLHPNTAGMLSSTIVGHKRGTRGVAVPGTPPDLRRLPPGSSFAPRCPHVIATCTATLPPNSVSR
jgi:oligopeptide/dipeptide ABC transporter ATP-binding protein